MYPEKVPAVMRIIDILRIKFLRRKRGIDTDGLPAGEELC